MSKINFKAKIRQIGTWKLIQLPETASKKLPSRGMCMGSFLIGADNFMVPLEPDGTGSHWFCINKKMRDALQADVGDTVSLSMEIVTDWPEPKVPADIQKAIKAHPKAQTVWNDTTVAARWDWIRWVRATNNPDTRKIRIEKTISKLESGKRRPCCFNRSMCTEPKVCKSGVLIE